MSDRLKLISFLLISTYLSLIAESKAGPPFGYYYTYDEIKNAILDLQSKHPDFVKVSSLPTKSIEDRDIFVVKFSNSPDANNNSPEVVISGAMHADEPIGPSVCMNDMNYLCDNYESDPEIKWLIDNRQIYFIPVMNPDGYVFNENFSSKRWRKNRRHNSDGSYGVDPNRNYPYKWAYDNSGSSSDPNAMNYRGPEPASEPETKAMMDFVNSHKIRTWQNHHSPADVLLIPFGHKDSYPWEDTLVYHTICREQDKFYGFSKWGNTHDAYGGFMVNGDAADWAWCDSATYKVYCLVTELGNGYWEDSAKIVDVCQRILGAELYMIQVAGFYPLLQEVSLIDTSAGCNSDGILNPNETAQLVVKIENKAVVDTTNVTAYLRSSDEYTEIKDSVSEFGNIKLLSDAINSSDPFTIYCKKGTSQGVWAHYNLKFTWNMNSVDFEKTFPCSLQIGENTEIINKNKTQGSGIGLIIIPTFNNRYFTFNLSIPQENSLENISNKVLIKIYDVLGRLVKKLDHNTTKSSNSVLWDGTNNSGKQVKDGAYFIEAKIGNYYIIKKLFILQ